MSSSFASPVDPSNLLKCINMKQLQDVVEDEVLNCYPVGLLEKIRNNKMLQQQQEGIVTPSGQLLSHDQKFLDEASIPKVLRRNSSFENIYLSKNERRVCVIYTGGTIGMVRSPRGGMIIFLYCIIWLDL
jgi:hypothetical protein